MLPCYTHIHTQMKRLLYRHTHMIEARLERHTDDRGYTMEAHR